MQTDEIPNSDGEVPYSFENLFFSRTNEKGHILSGNKTFQTISMYSWGELLNRPHNIIRHRDMPRGVFWLLWDTIKKGKPIAAYVKNRAKDGRYYWVLAIVTPIEGGYLSVRIKPSSELFPVVKREYHALHILEKNEPLKPAESATLLLERLKALGFRDYCVFMTYALGLEWTARDAQLGKAHNTHLNQLKELTNAAKQILTQSETIAGIEAASRYVPINLRVQAIKLGDAAAGIGVISQNYAIISSELKELTEHFIADTEKVYKTIHESLFFIGVAEAQTEILSAFKNEGADDAVSRTQDLLLLERQETVYRQKALSMLLEIGSQVDQFHELCADMRKSALGLDVARIMGKTETARQLAGQGELNAYLDDLENFQASLNSGLKEIQRQSRSILGKVQKLHTEAA